MARSSNPLTPYRVKAHRDRGYLYAFVWRTKTDPETNEVKRYQFMIGKIKENNKVIPNNEYRLLDIEERRKFIFPDDWDISEVNKLNGVGFKPVTPPEITFAGGGQTGEKHSDVQDNTQETEPHSPQESIPTVEETEAHTPEQRDTAEIEQACGNESYDDIYDVYDEHAFTGEEAQYNNRLYGNVWLLEQLAKKKGIYEDLLTVFNNDYGKVLDILSLAIYRIVDNRSFNRYVRWQKTHKILSNRNIYSGFVTKFTQSITEQHRMLFIQCRLNRQPSDAHISCDSTTRSGYGKCLVDVKWGHNKDDSDLKCSVEAWVYSLTTSEPIYYRRFSGETNDMITVVTIIQELAALGLSMEDVVFITDRGYCSLDNMGRYVKNGCPFITCSKVNQEPVTGALLKVEYDSVGCPENMIYDSETELYYGQFDAESFVVLLDDNKEFTVSGVKVNLYCDPKDRAKEIVAVRIQEKSEIAFVQELRNGTRACPSLEELRRQLKYHQVIEIKKSSSKITKSSETDSGNSKQTTDLAEDTLHLQFGEKRYVVVYNSDKVKKEYARCGFFASCMYKMDITAKDAYKTYLSRDEQEKSFFGLKDDINADKQECSSEEGQIGRLFIFFVANILVSTAKRVWKESLSDNYDSYDEVLDTMESIRFIQFPDQAHMTCFNTEQLEICKAFGVEVPTECLPATAKELLRKKLYPKKRGRKPKKEENAI